MIEDLRIIAKDGGRLSADDCRLIGAAADALEAAHGELARAHHLSFHLTQQVNDLRAQLANAMTPKPAVGALIAPAVFDQASYLALASKLSGGNVIAKPGEKPW